jgi:aryl-alcohol dehydrogenase-like predicted oxidoreductase
VALNGRERALELGVTFIDTADVYGDGHSEELVAKVIKGRRSDVVVATKGGLMGHHRDPAGAPVYDRPEKVCRALEDSLRRLGTDYVDVYYDHIWWDRPEEREAFVEALARLKADGKVRAAGLSTDDIDYIRHFNSNGGLDVVQVEYSVLNRRAEHEILPYLAEHGIGAVLRGPLQKGLLTGRFTADTTFPEGDVRADWPEQDWYRRDLARVGSLRRLERDDMTLGQLALRSSSTTRQSRPPSPAARHRSRWPQTPRPPRSRPSPMLSGSSSTTSRRPHCPSQGSGRPGLRSPPSSPAETVGQRPESG